MPNAWPADCRPTRLPDVLVLLTVSVVDASVVACHSSHSAARRGSPSGTPGGGGSQCDTGSISCCNSYGSASGDSTAVALLSLLNLSSDYPVGTGCSGVSSVNDW